VSTGEHIPAAAAIALLTAATSQYSQHATLAACPLIVAQSSGVCVCGPDGAAWHVRLDDRVQRRARSL